MAEWRYIVLKPALRYLERLRPDDQERIINALEVLLIEPERADLKPLKGFSSWRLRVGDYRVLLQVDREVKLFIVTRIGPRGDVYKC